MDQVSAISPGLLPLYLQDAVRVCMDASLKIWKGGKVKFHVEFGVSILPDMRL